MFHGRAWPDDVREPSAWFLDVTEPALVLGSTQSDAVVDHARARAAGVEVVRRRSGGGAVLLRPGELIWVDLFVPAGDPLWEVDVSRAFHWAGEAWTEALADVGVDAGWHHGAPVGGPWSSLVCFAGLGPGEVSGRPPPPGTGGVGKIVGISQRRTRAGAMFQCGAVLGWDPWALLDLLRMDEDDRRRGADALRTAAAAVGVDGHRLEDALLERLARR